jgi:hypothetical protein
MPKWAFEIRRPALQAQYESVPDFASLKSYKRELIVLQTGDGDEAVVLLDDVVKRLRQC